jgi:2-dehydropantoate 2-reductase
MEPKYLLIGSGRLGTHLRHYFELLGLSVTTWSRHLSKDELIGKAAGASHILCLINDGAIAGFLTEHRPLFSGRTVLHCSGALATPLAPSAHPLMTFTAGRFYDRADYESIPFILEQGRGTMAELLPGLPNPHFTIPAEAKILYHALCVMSGNFTVQLWQKAFAGFAELGLPREVLLPYLRRICENLATDPELALTGPLARGDRETVIKHLAALEGDEYAPVYRALAGAKGLEV